MISSTILSMISFAVICVVGVLLHVFFSIKGVKGFKDGGEQLAQQHHHRPRLFAH